MEETGEVSDETNVIPNEQEEVKKDDFKAPSLSPPQTLKNDDGYTSKSATSSPIKKIDTNVKPTIINQVPGSMGLKVNLSLRERKLIDKERGNALIGDDEDDMETIGIRSGSGVHKPMNKTYKKPPSSPRVKVYTKGASNLFERQKKSDAKAKEEKEQKVAQETAAMDMNRVGNRSSKLNRLSSSSSSQAEIKYSSFKKDDSSRGVDL